MDPWLAPSLRSGLAKDDEAEKTISALAHPPFSLQGVLALSIEPSMNTRRVMSVSSSVAFATATVRALSSTLLLLGLIGDRRAR
jgi:hypothetical protein